MITKKDKIIAVIWVAICIILPTKFRVVFGRGESMKPTFTDKTIMLCIKQKEYEINDIVMFKLNGFPIVHRIIEKGNYNGIVYYQTKGDNNDGIDFMPITKEQIKCKVIN